MKNKLRTFFTLDPRHQGGFTLVELIVVITILAILAGVAAPAYSGYIKAAGQGTDRSTVGNIMRAAEYGSYLFELDDPLQMGSEGLALPLGFVVLTDQGMTGMVSGSEMETFVPSDEPCKLYKIGEFPNTNGQAYPVINVEGGDYSNIPSANKRSVTASVHGGSGSITLLVQSEMPQSYSGSYCYTCSLRNGAICEKSTRIRSNTVVTTDASLMQAAKDKKLSEAQKQYFRDNVGTFAIMDMSKLVTSGCVDGEARPVHSYGSVGVEAGTIGQLMEMAFGTDYQNVKLQGDWSAEGMSYILPTMYANAGALITDLEGMVQNAMNNETFGSTLGDNINQVMETYLPDIAERYTTEFSKEDYVAAWGKLAADGGSTGSISADLSRWGGYFGYTLGDLTNATQFGNKAGYMVGVGAYNAGFASYVRSVTPPQGTHDANDHASKIVNYGDALEYGVQDNFNDAALVSAKTFAEGGKLACPACASLLSQYLANEAWRVNAETFYDLLVTVDDTSAKAITESKIIAQEGDNKNYGYMDWYKDYVSEFQNLYGEVAGKISQAESAVVIIFQRNPDGSIGFDVYPEEANPRKD